MKAAVCYIDHKIKISRKSDLLKELDEIYLRKTDKDFLIDIINGLSYQDLMKKYKISKSRVYQKRETIFETLRRWDFANEKKQAN